MLIFVPLIFLYQNVGKISKEGLIFHQILIFKYGPLNQLSEVHMGTQRQKWQALDLHVFPPGPLLYVMVISLIFLWDTNSGSGCVSDFFACLWDSLFLLDCLIKPWYELFCFILLYFVWTCFVAITWRPTLFWKEREWRSRLEKHQGQRSRGRWTVVRMYSMKGESIFNFLKMYVP